LRPRKKEAAETSPLTAERLMRMPLRFAGVLGAVTYPADVPFQRFFSVMTDLSTTTVARPKMKSTLPLM
jgi:hypothetical protein